MIVTHSSKHSVGMPTDPKKSSDQTVVCGKLLLISSLMTSETIGNWAYIKEGGCDKYMTMNVFSGPRWTTLITKCSGWMWEAPPGFRVVLTQDKV